MSCNFSRLALVSTLVSFARLRIFKYSMLVLSRYGILFLIIGVRDLYLDSRNIIEIPIFESQYRMKDTGALEALYKVCK